MMVNKYHKENAPTKGHGGKHCNVTACQEPNSAFYYNTAMRAWYCRACASEINRFAKMDGKDFFPHFEKSREWENEMAMGTEIDAANLKSLSVDNNEQ